MPIDSQNDWPENIAVDVVTPRAYLLTQASLLGGLTNGLLRADVRSVSSEQGVAHSFELVAPVLDNFRKEIFVVEHEVAEPYPTVVYTDDLGADITGVDLTADYGFNLRKSARGYAELRGIVRMILRSSSVKAAIESMLARINEKTSLGRVDSR